MIKKFFLLCCTIIAHCLQAEIDWSDPQIISDAGYTSSNPQVMNDQGHGIIIWQQQNGAIYNVYVSCSADYGETWTTPEMISTPGESARTPKVTIDYTAHAIATWRSNNTVQVACSCTCGNGWSVPQTLSSGYALDPEIAMDLSGNAVIIWREISGSVKIKAAYSSDHGATWSTGTFISSAASYSPQVEMDESGHVVAVWQQQAATYVIASAQSDDYGATWSSPAVISETGVASEVPQIALNNTGHAVALWRQQTANTVQTVYSADYGIT